ncbi:MAG: hypothetical protein O7G83_01075, partial [Proteobacteria bacterium]|nr:hypothetical protein [Pseudomonadota bacterium]
MPATGSVFQCDIGVIDPGNTEQLTFDVVKNPDPNADDDLSFRVDVIGEITLSDGTPLWFPAPTPRSDGITDRANNYSLDALRARVVGYNLAKTQLGTCSENNPPPAGPDLDVQVGEECAYHVESGGWFGFQTPGFTYIAVQNIQVVDEIPDGQGYISSTDPFAPGMSTAQIQNVQLNPPPLPLAEGWFNWTFNTVTPAERITVKDHWFRVNVTTRLLNDPIDTSAAPNLHAAASTNILNSTFEAVFFNPISNMEEIFNLGPTTIGFPPEIRRRVDLTVTEPNLTVVKEVCNETIYGTGPTCSNFVTLADDGNAFETYIYRITVTNEASASGVSRAPAYDVTVTSVTDATDLIFVDPLASDGLDNDGNALVDEVAGEGQVVPDNIVQNGTPAQIVASYTHSDALLRINAGDSVVLYYRVDPDDNVAPLQQLTNSVTASYDSLEGVSGNQTAPLGANGEIGGARQYVTASAEATIQIIPVQVSPKQIMRLSNSVLSAPVTPQPVSIGEEIEFELRTLIPIAQLRSFIIRDDLPAGISCVEAPAVNLDAPPYSAAGFMPGGIITPTCTGTAVVWNFGDQTVTQSPGGGQRFDFGIRFIARVDNTLANQDGLAISNGGTSTVANVSYINEIGNSVVLDFAAADAIVREPLVVLTKTFSVLQVDAADVPTVTISATNNGSATAYNLRVLDNLTAVNLSYAGQVGGVPPPNVDIITFGADSPLFSWNPGFAIAPGQTISFTFAVQVAGAVQPQEVLSNTVQADWTSLPTQGTTLNSGGTIGLNGSATGMRNGALPNLGDLLNDYETQASAAINVPPVAMTKIDLSPALAPEIGAHKLFQVEISLPEGVSNGLSVSDNLSFGSVSYVLADNADFGITYEFVGIATINGQVPSAAAFTAVPSDGASGTAVWNIGAVATQSEDDLTVQALNPAIRINYFARINNDLVTNVGSTLQNSASVTYINGATGATETLNGTTASITAIESALTATKAISNVTPGKAPTDPLELGDIVQYVVTIPNGGNAMAYDGNIVDTLPPELAFYGGFVPTATINGVAAPGFIGVPTGAPDSPLIWGAGNGDGSLDIPPGGVLELTYQVFVQTPSPDNIALTNSVWVDWTSLDGVSSYERTGIGCPITTAPNDYCFGPATVAGIPVPLPPPDVLVKANTQATAAIGEPFSYLVTIPSTPHSQPLYDVRITDDLAASAADLVFIGVSKVTGSLPWTPVNTGTATSLVIEDI